MLANFAIAAIVTALTALLVGGMITRYGNKLGLVDVPNKRSSHTAPTPRGGGVGILAGVAAGMLILALVGKGPERHAAAILLTTAPIAFIGILDDARSVPASWRLMVQIAAATTLTAVLGPTGRMPLPPPLDVSLGYLAWPFTILWLVAITNFFNFMDGLDGLATGQTAVTCIGVLVAGWATSAVRLSALLISAAAGFLVLNRPPARVFLGDVGSTSLGFSIAAMPLLAPADRRGAATLAIAIGLSLFILDPLETLGRRALTGQGVGKAHRQHSYQQLCLSWSSRRVAVTVVVVGLCLSVAGGLTYNAIWLGWPTILVAALAFITERALAGRAASRLSVDPNPIIGSRDG